MVSGIVRWTAAVWLLWQTGVAALGEASGPTAWIDLGLVNVEHGLSLADGGDGENEPALVGGSKCRRNSLESNPPSRHLYFDFDRSAGRLRRPAYVTVEYFDEGFGTFQIQYDSADTGASDRGAYKQGATEILLDSREWRKTTFELADARFDGRQNMGTDFRLFCSGQIAVRKVLIEMGSSADFEELAQAQRERIAKCVGKLVPPRGLQVIFSGPEAAFARDAAQALSDLRILAPIMKALGATSVESYVKWELVEPRRGQWDWSFYDEVVAILRENGLKWVPFVIAGPAYATPGWFRESDESVFAQCLEHGADSKIQSIWNPRLPEWIDRLVARFAERYGSSGSIESILVGVSGDFGESIYPVSGGGWTYIVPGEYHTHLGYWCGDRHAREDFRQYVAEQYGSVDVLNTAWGTSYSSLDEVAPFLPESNPSPRARLDLIEWYRGRMTKWTAYWLGTVRNYLPHTDLYICTGGDGHPAHGSDFAAQCKTAGKFGAGVRITNEASDYGANFAITRLVAAACAHYGAYCSFEPAGDVTNDGIHARIYNAVTSRVRGIHTYHPVIIWQPGAIPAWSRSYKWLGAEVSRRPYVAVLLPQTSLALRWGGLHEKIASLRDAVDFDLVDEPMIRDGALSRYKALVIVEGKVLERDDILRILDWVRAGGVVVACEFGGISTVDGDSSLFGHIFDLAGSEQQTVRSIGEGLSVYVREGWGGASGPIPAIARALDSLSTRARSNLVPDGVVDGIYVSDTGGGHLLVYNSTGKEVERELQVGIGRRRTVKLPSGISRVSSE